MKERLILLMVVLCSPRLAFAYIDPGTGAYLVQMIVALIGAVAFYATHPIKLIKKIFSKFFGRDERS